MQERQSMQKRTIKIKKFELPVYSASVAFVYSNNFEDIAKFAAEEGLHENDVKTLNEGKYFGYTFMVEDDYKGGRTHNYIFVKKFKNKYDEIDIITHEILHAVVNILTHRGLKFNKHNEEAYTYLNGYLNKEFFKFKDGKE